MIDLRYPTITFLFLALATTLAGNVRAELTDEDIPPVEQSGDSSADLAKELTNPVADLITIPVQMTYDRRIGSTDAGPEGWRLRFQANFILPR